jgi:hypothetical protein
MIEIEETIIDKLIFHKISSNDNLSVINDKLYEYDNGEEETVLKNIFLKPFLSQSSTYEFKHDIDLDLNPLFQLSKDIYNGEDFIEKSKDIFTHLKTVSKHPNIKDGDLFIVKYEDIIFNNGYYEAVGIYKIENKENFIEIEKNNTLKFKKGIGNKKLDKACLILFADEPYTIFIIDNANKDTEYWKDDFINVKSKNDFVNNTNNFLQLTQNFAHNSGLPKVDQIDLLNKSIGFFKEKDSFNLDEFTNEVMQQPDIIQSFTQYKSEYQKEFELDIADNFTISDSAVKKQARIYKSVIKLDKNFDIYIHGNRNLIEQGADENGTFYKIYYKEEN